MKNRRAHPRFEVQIEGKLMAPDMSTCVDVVIKDLSVDGALVSARASADFQPEQRAYLWQAQTRTLFECTVRWSESRGLLGLQFADSASRERRINLLEAATSVWRRGKQRTAARTTMIHCADFAA